MAENKSLDVKRMVARLGLTHVAEAMFYVPRTFKDYRNPIRLASQLVEGTEQAGIFKVSSKTYYDANNKLTTYKAMRIDVVLRDSYNQIVKTCVFGNIWGWKDINPGDEVALYGTVKQFGSAMTIANPSFIPKYLLGKMAPVYAAVRSLASAETVYDLTRMGLQDLSDASTLLAGNAGMREEDLAKASGFDGLDGFLRALHNPNTPEEFKKAMTGALEICKAETLEKARRVKARNPSKSSVILVNKDAHKNFTYYNLTDDQRAAMIDVLNDLRSPMPMRRLLSGDVGTGKSAAFMLPAAEAFRNGAVVHIVAPNQPLVKQLADEMQKFFPDIPVEMVTSKAKPKGNVRSILIGTTALVNYDIKNNIKPDLLIVDEQHKMSREQREQVCGPNTNVLESTATAIPRSMALITHGGMDVSLLKKCPVIKNITTSIVNTPEGRKDSHAQLRKILADGGQIAIVYSLVEEGKDSELQSVEAAFTKWEAAFPGLVTMAHGKMKDDQKHAAIDAMKSGEKSVLVCSTVIEVGLTIPELRGMLVVNPERYGVSQLHQLRGRLSRLGGLGSMFLYLPNDVSDETFARMQLVVDESDGFKLSEMDMENRGFGDLGEDSDDQSGNTVLTLKNVKIKPSDFMEKKPVIEAVSTAPVQLKLTSLDAVDLVADSTEKLTNVVKRVFKF